MAVLIYGAYGYTGTLITRRCLDGGVPAVIAGRDKKKLSGLAEAHELQSHVVDLHDSASLDRVLSSVEVVLHCAGPFRYTVQPMIEACLRTGTHYLDIAGELPVFQSLEEQDARFREAGIMVVPGVGFDVVPSDCLAAYVCQHIASVTHLEVAIAGSKDVSRGTARTALEQLGDPSLIRKDGRLEAVPAAWKVKAIRRNSRSLNIVSVPLGDLVTAHRSTGAPNIIAYAALPPFAATMLRLSNYLGWFFQWGPIKNLLRTWIEFVYEGPDDEARSTGRSFVWAMARNGEGERIEARLYGPEVYSFTTETAVRAAQKVLAGAVKPGFQTPVTAFGMDWVFDIDGVRVTLENADGRS